MKTRFFYILPLLVFSQFLQSCSVASLIDEIEDQVSTSVNECADDVGACEDAMLESVNVVRLEPQDCGDEGLFDVTTELVWNDDLAEAALVHARDMAENEVRTHEGSDGSDVFERVQAEGYEADYVLENLAYGMGSVAEAMSGWMSSDGHCANIMNTGVTEFGMAYIEESDTNPHLWVQVFAKPADF